MDEVKQALDKVVSDGMKAIDALTPNNWPKYKLFQKR